MRKIASAVLVCLYLSAHLTGCTSGESREESVGSEETAAVDSELEKVDGADGGAKVDEANSGFVDETLPEQALGEQPATPQANGAPSELALDSAPTDSAPPAETALAANGNPDDSALDLGPSSPPPEAIPDPAVAQVAPEPAPLDGPAIGVDPGAEQSAQTTPTEVPAAEAAGAVAATSSSGPKASLKKIKDAPFREHSQLLNAVYVARSGDNYKKISKKIYGDASKVSDLKKANPSIANVNVGDKVYYNSPNRPTDDTTMKTYYDDTGVASETYVAKEGDDLKKVAKQLLGEKSNWKELWVTNKDLETKGALVAGTEIHYWKKTDASEAKPSTEHSEMAGMTTPPPMQGELPPVAQQMPPPSQAMNSAPPPPMDQLPPPADMNSGMPAAGTAVAEAPPPPPPAEMAPPPPPPAEIAPPPPPPEAVRPPKAQIAADTGAMSNDDMMMGLGAAGILAAGIAAIMVVRKRRQQKEMASAFGDTQIGAS